jgi:hypothetical protein
MENTNDFWANVSMVAVSPVAIAAGFAKGAYDASTNVTGQVPISSRRV